MLNPQAFHALVSGQKRGVGPAVARALLRVGEIPYRWAVQYRNRRYDRGQTAVHRLPVPVVSVGNLTLGGTGKTPLVAWLAHWFSDRGLRTAIVSRGYRMQDGRNDEACELARDLPQVPHIQHRDRFWAGSQAVRLHGAQRIILDDGFQHRRLHRDLDIVLLDALQPFGWGHLFPRGTLREPVHGLRRAHVVVLSRSSLTDPHAQQAAERQVRQLAPHALWLTADHHPIDLRFADGRSGQLDALASVRTVAFCAIGNPDGFRRTLHTVHCQPVEFHSFPDHYAFSAGDLHWLENRLTINNAQLLVCTQKDLVKLERLGKMSVPLCALRIVMQIHGATEKWRELLMRLSPS